jgi:glyoxylase-like metal-dependent hydrolase (beta-lactamase superfamily II)
MKIHHLNCVTACPLGGLLMDGMSKQLRGRLTSHCLLLETAQALVLIDTGYGLRDVAAPRTRLSSFFLELCRPELREDMTAVRQIRALGYAPEDVRHIVLSHLDFDHAGGLDDFPRATVHVMEDEVASASAQATWLDRQRYRPAQWSSRDAWNTYGPRRGEPWHGFECVRDLVGLPPEVLLVPLAGHTLGHAGVAIARGPGWLFYAADAYFYYAEMDARPRCTSGLRLYQAMMDKDREQRLFNQARLRELKAAAADVTVFCAHDVREFERMSGRASDQPAIALSPGTSEPGTVRAASVDGSLMP